MADKYDDAQMAPHERPGKARGGERDKGRDEDEQNICQ